MQSNPRGKCPLRDDRTSAVLSFGIGFCLRLHLIGQSLSAFRASSLKNVSAVCSLHSLSEAMLLLSLKLLGLVSSEHFLHLLINLSEAFAFQPFYAFTQ